MLGIGAKIIKDNERAFFEMSFCPSLEFVSLVRRFIGTFYLHVLGDADLASRVALATHELLENAVKYSSDGEANIRLVIAALTTHPMIELRTRNRTSPGQAAALARNIQEMNALKDPFNSYQTLMRRSANSGVTGGLGLGRIAAEAEMEVSCDVHDDMVEVFARTTETP